MCDPVTGALAVGTALSAGSSIMGGMAASSGAKIEADRYEIQRENAATEGSFAESSRSRELAQLMAANAVAAGASGLTADSFAAITEGNVKAARRDMVGIRLSTRSRQAEMRAAGAAALYRGRGQLMAGFFDAAGTVARGAYAYETGRGPGQKSIVDLFG